MSNDPIITVIAEHRYIYKVWHRAEGRAQDQLFELYVDASQRLFETTPSTIGGTLALLNYVIGKHDNIEHWNACGVDFSRILRSICKRLTTGGGEVWRPDACSPSAHPPCSPSAHTPLFTRCTSGPSLLSTLSSLSSNIIIEIEREWSY